MDNIYEDGTTFQGAIMRDGTGATSEITMPCSYRGVILEVRYSDDIRNRSASEMQDRRGYIAECTVLLVDKYDILKHVLIPPPSPSGLDNFEEILPRGTTSTIYGDPFEAGLGGVDPYDLDGDWCIVSFLNGNSGFPYVSSWWANPRNNYDPATSGKAYPSFTDGEGRALDQSGRYFRRINGVECVVNNIGDVWLSTTLAGSTIQTGSAEENQGRFPRKEVTGGGSVKLNVNSEASFELTFAERIDGVGAGGLDDPSLPQKQPPSTPPSANANDDNANIIASKGSVRINVPEHFEVKSKDTATIAAETGVKVGSSDATEAMVLGDKLREILSQLTVTTPFGPSGTPINAPDFINFLSTKNKVD